MRVRYMVVTLSVFALAALTVAQTASAATTNAPSLWSSTFTPAQTDCGAFSRDTNNFCWTEGGDTSLAGPGVEARRQIHVLAEREHHRGSRVPRQPRDRHR